MNLFTTVANVNKLLDTSEEANICYLDFIKAFDAVNHRVVCAVINCIKGFNIV